MSTLSTSNVFLVKEHRGIFKAANNYDIYDPEDGQMVMQCREENLGFFTKTLRFTDYKRMTPFDITIKDMHGQQIVRVKRGVSFFLSKVDVLDANDVRIGGFKQKFFSIGGSFDVLDANDTVICTLKGKWSGWDFTFKAGNDEFAKVSKKWAGIGRELFTSADNYVLQISDKVPADSSIRSLILGAVMCIDMVLKE